MFRRLTTIGTIALMAMVNAQALALDDSDDDNDEVARGAITALEQRVSDVEHQGQPGGQQKQHDAQLQAVQHLLQEQQHLEIAP